MADNVNFRLDMVSTGRIKRMPGIKADAKKKDVAKARDFTRKRGCCMPVVLSDAEGCMTLLAGAATFDAYLEDKRPKVPAVVVQTEGGADDMMFALQSADLDRAPDALTVGAILVQLIDAYGVPRKHIAKSLGRSPAWINRMEGLSRRLNGTVQGLVAEGHVSPRMAQEIARLPDDVQAQFAVAVGNEFLSKDSVAYLVSRYLSKDAGPEERARIIRTPKLALPNEWKWRGKKAVDKSDDARLSRAIARCLDDASYLARLLRLLDIGAASICTSDAFALADSLDALSLRIRTIFAPGGKAERGMNTDKGGIRVD